MAVVPSPGRPVLVVDDDDGCRALMSTVLESGGYPIVESATGEQAIQLAALDPPALVVLDVCLPGVSGYQVCRVLRDRFGDGLPIIFVSGVRTESFDRVAGLLVGADDYLEKPFAPDELFIRVERLIRRSSPLAPTIAARLTTRERQVLSLLGEGLGAHEIAERLYISPKTVGTHCENILRKLGVRTRAQAVALAFRQQLVDAPPSTKSRSLSA
jgi:DNA-binding NarL/FixJ family response regulator